MDIVTPPGSPESGNTHPRTPVLSKLSREIVEKIQPGSGVPSSGKFQLSPVSWSSSTTDSDATVEIPEYLESRETLQYLEVDSVYADKIWSHYLDVMSRRSLGPYTFFDVVKGHILHRHEEDAVSEADDWEGVIQRCGIKRQFTDRIMKAQWKTWRLSGSAKDWIRLSLEDRWYFLESLDSIVQSPDRDHTSQVTNLDDSGIMVTTFDGSSSRSQSYKTSGQVSKEAVTGSQSGTTKTPSKGIFAAPKPAAPSVRSYEAVPEDMPGCKRLFKGGARARLESVFDTDGKLNFRDRILSTPPGDFDQNTRGLYLTSSNMMAWEYAQWVNQVDGADGPSVGIMTIFIPNELLVSQVGVVGDRWREFVWVNRRMMEIPEEFEEYDSYDWLVGPVCGQSVAVVQRAQSSAELKAFRLSNGESASQWFTRKRGLLRKIQDECAGKVWVTEVRSQGLR